MPPNLCRCRQCGPDGRRLGTIEFLNHRIAETRREALFRIPSESSIEEPTLPSPRAPIVKVGQPSRVHKNDVPSAHCITARQWLAQVDAQLLQRNASILGGRLRSYSFRFAIPPQDQNHLHSLVDPKVLSLDEDSPNNYLALSHERWLDEQQNAGHSYLNNCVGDVSLSRELLLMLKRLERDNDKTCSMKRLEWERQWHIALEINQVDPGTSIHSYECSWLTFNAQDHT